MAVSAGAVEVGEAAEGEVGGARGEEARASLRNSSSSSSSSEAGGH